MEAIVEVSLQGPDELRADIDATIDTGFAGQLALPRFVIDQFGLRFELSSHAQLADGSVIAVDYFRGTIAWDGESREVQILSAETDPLIGTALLSGYRVTIDMAPDGNVAVERLMPG